MARPRKSEQLHQLQGTVSQVKPVTESHVVGGRPKIPSDLDKGLRRIFKDLCRLLSERRALSKGDVELVRLYCFVYDRHRKEVAALREEGCVMTYYRLNNHGESVPQVKENIRLKICSAAEKQMASILSQLGMTPTAKDRARPVSTDASKEKYAPGTIGWLKQRGEFETPNNLVVLTPPEAEEEEQ
jgi:P27 family predicted phage terminase small subunit